MGSTAITETELRRFFIRKRYRYGDVEIPALSPWLCQTLELVAKLVPSEAGSVLLDDPTADRLPPPLTFVAAFGRASQAVLGSVVAPGQGVVGYVFRSGRTYATATPRRDPHFSSQTEIRSSFQTRSVVAAPICIERRVCGVLELVNRKGRRGFSERDIVLVEHLAQHVSRAVTNAVDVLKQNYLATHDALTELRNTRALDGYLRDALKRALRRRGGDLALLFVDVDRLKHINDRQGHRAGSEAIRRVAAAARDAVADRGEVFRFGGDELVIVCPNANLDTALHIGADIGRAVRKTVRGPMSGGGTLPTVTASIGAATLRSSMKKGNRNLPARLLGAADRALYRAKEGGRDLCLPASRRDDALRQR